MRTPRSNYLLPCLSQKACQEISCLAPVVDAVDRYSIIVAYESTRFGRAARVPPPHVGRLHFCWFEDTVHILPLTPEKICAVSALLKHRGYSSGMAHISVIKCVSRQLGLPVDQVTHL